MAKAVLILAQAVAVVGCKPEIQLVHVQDSTATFAGVVKSFKDKEIIEGLLEELRSEYGRVKYGLSSFQDKPAPFTGYGLGYSLWQKQWNHDFAWDDCYTNILPLSDAAGDIWSRVKVSGGKDGEENQLDAMARAAIDPVHWSDGHSTHNEYGQPIARLALMLTDDFAHHGVTNDYHATGFDVSFKGSTKYWNEKFGSFEEDNYDYRVKSDFAGAALDVPYGPDGASVRLEGDRVYEAFVLCNDAKTDDAYRRSTLAAWVKAGADIGPSNLDAAEEVQNWWAVFCAREYETRDADGKFTGVFEFVNNYKLVETGDVQDYPYQDIDFSGDCTKYEYPDTNDPRYAGMFKKFGVIPIGVVAPPATGQPNEYTYRTKAYTILTSHCPGVRAGCQSRLISDCTGPYGRSEWPISELEARLADCYSEHYSLFFSNLRANGVPSVYLQMEPGHLDGSLLAVNMKRAIDAAVSSLVCADPTTSSTAEAPPTPVASMPLSSTADDGTSGDSLESTTTFSSSNVEPGTHFNDTVGIAVGSVVSGAVVVGAVASYLYKNKGGSRAFDMQILDDIDDTNFIAERETYQVVDLEMYN